MDVILCDELLQEVFHRLPPPSSAAASLVSKRWLRLLRSSLSALSLRLPPSHPSLPTFLSHHTSLRSLSLSSASTADRLLAAVAAACPNLTHLSLAAAPAAPSALVFLSNSCPNLSSLALILSRPHNFQFLSFFPNLKTLTLTLIGQVTLDSHVPDDSPPPSTELRLQALTVTGIRAGDAGISWLWRNCSPKTLTKLVLENCESVGDNLSFSRFIEALSNLHELELKTCRSIIGLVLLRLMENRCDSLESLAVYDGACKEVLLQFLRETPCPLRKLDLRLPLDLNDSHLIEIGANFRRLSALCLQSCCLVTGEGLKSLGLALGDNLDELSLINCDVIKRESGFLVELAQNLKKINNLDLSYNHMLFDKEFASMMGSCRGLRHLKLRGCGRLTNASLVSLCKHCKHLESIDVVDCHGIEEGGVEFVILNSPQLRKLQVEERKVSEVMRRWVRNKFIEVQAQ